MNSYIWVDAQLSPAIATWITANFTALSATAVRDLGLREADDETIFLAARKANVIVMSKDSDFVDLHLRLGAPPKVIWLTCGNTSNKRLQQILASKLPEAVELFAQGNELVEISGY